MIIRNVGELECGVGERIGLSLLLLELKGGHQLGVGGLKGESVFIMEKLQIYTEVERLG